MTILILKKTDASRRITTSRPRRRHRRYPRSPCRLGVWMSATVEIYINNHRMRIYLSQHMRKYCILDHNFSFFFLFFTTRQRIPSIQLTLFPRLYNRLSMNIKYLFPIMYIAISTAQSYHASIVQTQAITPSKVTYRPGKNYPAILYSNSHNHRQETHKQTSVTNKFKLVWQPAFCSKKHDIDIQQLEDLRIPIRILLAKNLLIFFSLFLFLHPSDVSISSSP